MEVEKMWEELEFVENKGFVVPLNILTPCMVVYDIEAAKAGRHACWIKKFATKNEDLSDFSKNIRIFYIGRPSL
jgi:hypothetical protein